MAINEKLVFTRLQTNELDVPMICGLKCVYTNELPDKMLFSVFRADNPPLTLAEENKKLKQELRELRDKMNSIAEIIYD